MKVVNKYTIYLETDRGRSVVYLPKNAEILYCSVEGGRPRLYILSELEEAHKERRFFSIIGLDEPFDDIHTLKLIDMCKYSDGTSILVFEELKEDVDHSLAQGFSSHVSKLRELYSEYKSWEMSNDNNRGKAFESWLKLIRYNTSQWISKVAGYCDFDVCGKADMEIYFYALLDVVEKSQQ